MSFTNQNDRITRYAVALQGAIRKTVNVKLNDETKPITAMHVDNQQNVLSTKTLQQQASNASFDFDDDGELWLVEGTEAPSLQNPSAVAFGDSQLNMQVEISEIGDRDVTSNPTPVIKPDEA